MVSIIITIVILAIILWFVRDLISAAFTVFAIFTLAWFLWYATGGVERFEKSNQGIFIRPNADYTNFETYGEFPIPPQLKN